MGHEEQVDRRVVPEDAHLSVAFDLVDVVIRPRDLGRQRGENGTRIVGRNEQVQIDVARAAGLGDVEGQGQRASERMRDADLLERVLDGQRLLGERRHRPKRG